MNFVVKKYHCLGCKAPVSDTFICDDCIKYEKAIYYEMLQKKNQLEHDHCRIWSNCQKCQHTLHSAISCERYDCSAFFLRHDIDKKLEKLTEEMNMKFPNQYSTYDDIEIETPKPTLNLERDIEDLV
jgi:DNA polymerase delta subunit 1